MSTIYDSTTTIISLCGGGMPAVLYGAGILYSLYKSGELLETDSNGNQVINSKLLITASSGGVIPLLLLDLILSNKLHHIRLDWFEYYIINTINKFNPNAFFEIYGTSLIKSLSLCIGTTDLTRICSENILNLLRKLIPSELLNANAIYFTEESRFKYNYVVDTSFTESPIISNDFTHLNNFDLLLQLSEVMVSCCIVASISQIKNGIFNDAAIFIDNDILELHKYKNLRTIHYYTLNAYDRITNNSSTNVTSFIKHLTTTSVAYYNYRAINNIKRYVKSFNLEKSENQQIIFNLMSLPNKFNPIRKYNNKIYKELIPYFFYQDDFNVELIKLSGILNFDSRTVYIFFLIGMFETLYIYKVNEETAKKYTYDLPEIFKEVLDDPYNIYFTNFSHLKRQFFSLLSIPKTI